MTLRGEGRRRADPVDARSGEMSPQLRRSVLRNSLGVGLATGAYGVSFGAVSVAAGLDLPQTCALSALMFTGGSQFALVGVLGAGGAAGTGVATALLLGARNTLYGIRLAPLLGVRGPRRAAAAHLVLDESTAMAIAQPVPAAGRLAFWATGAAVFTFWNLMTLAGAAGAAALGDPRTYGLDAASPAAFIALVAPRLRGRSPWVVAVGGAVVALLVAPHVAAGVPVLLAALVAVAVGVRR